MVSTDLPSWYPDSDGDGYGNPSFVIQCEQPYRVDNADDCNDTMSGSIPRMISFIWMMVSTLPLMMEAVCAKAVCTWTIESCAMAKWICVRTSGNKYTRVPDCSRK